MSTLRARTQIHEFRRCSTATRAISEHHRFGLDVLEVTQFVHPGPFVSSYTNFEFND